MNFLRSGNFFGQTNRIIRLGGITLTDTEYTHSYVDWHFHENAYFTFILLGKLIEGNKRATYSCSNGGLLFHSWQEPHFNIKPDGYTRGFHIEFDKDCFKDLSLDIRDLDGSFIIENPDIKFLLYKIFRETTLIDDLTATSIKILLFDVFGQMLRFQQTERETQPQWAKKLKEILSDARAERHSLLDLSNELNIHPAHLSRAFSKYFDCTFAEYVRKLRVEKSLSLLPDKTLSLTEIAFECGFADQSHFLRCFKKINGVKPSEYRRVFLT